jgi:GntR family transcriptional repressor for pyruvate dehydrogenase complex
VAVAEASQNLVLVRVMFTLLDLLEAARRECLSIPGRPELSLTQHENVLREIEARNPEAARRVMLEHLTSVEQSITYPGRTGREDAG